MQATVIQWYSQKYILPSFKSRAKKPDIVRSNSTRNVEHYMARVKATQSAKRHLELLLSAILSVNFTGTMKAINKSRKILPYGPRNY